MMGKKLVPDPYPCDMTTCYSSKLMNFSLVIPGCYKDIDVISFFSCKTRYWNSLPAEFFTFLLIVFPKGSSLSYFSFNPMPCSCSSALWGVNHNSTKCDAPRRITEDNHDKFSEFFFANFNSILTFLSPEQLKSANLKIGLTIDS